MRFQKNEIAYFQDFRFITGTKGLPVDVDFEIEQMDKDGMWIRGKGYGSKEDYGNGSIKVYLKTGFKPEDNMVEIKKEPDEIRMELGDRCGCVSGDKIYVEMSPHEVFELHQIFEEKATRYLNTERDIDDVKHDITRHDKYEKIYREWEKKREEKDQGEKTC